MAGIEFVEPEPDPGSDEELDSGPRRAGSRRTRVTVGAALLAAVAAAVLIPALRHDSTRSTAGPSIASARSAAPTGTTPVAPAGPTSPPDIVTDVPVLSLESCPNLDACETQLILPVAVRDAVRAALPGVGAVEGGSVLVRGRRPTLRSRQVVATDGHLTVDIRIRPATLHELPTARTGTAGGDITRTATEIDGGFAVTVRVRAADDVDPGPTTVRVLAADRRLLAI